MTRAHKLAAEIVACTRVPLTELHVDAIVNAANNELEGGGGVCGAIYRAAGPELPAACRKLGSCETGEVKMTPGFNLAAKFIIHAVGPKSDQPARLLASCYSKALDLAARHHLRSVAFPCISTGIYGFDPALAANTAMRAVKDWLELPANSGTMDQILFVLFSEQEETIYAERWHTFFPPPAEVRAISATSPATSGGTDRATTDPPWRPPTVTCGRQGCVTPPEEIDIRPGSRQPYAPSLTLARPAALVQAPPGRPVFGPELPPAMAAAERAAALASARTRRETAGAATAPEPELAPLNPGTDPGPTSRGNPGIRERPRYFEAPAPKPRSRDTRDLGFAFPERTQSESWYDTCATARKQPADMPVEVINIVSAQDSPLDERGTDGAGHTPPALYLDVALSTYDTKTKVRGPRSRLVRAHRDDGAACSLINPDLLDASETVTIQWRRSDRKLLSATNHSLQGVANDKMTTIVMSFPDGKGGWINILEKVYACTTIPFAILLGRPIIENAPLRRFGDSSNGVQRFGDLSSPFMPPPARRPVGQSVHVPVWAVRDTLLMPGVPATIACTTGSLFSNGSGELKVRTANIETDIGNEEEVHANVDQVITVDGRLKMVMMTNDGKHPVLIAAGSRVVYARLIDDYSATPIAPREFDPAEAAADPFGVGAISTAEVLEALTSAISSRLSDHPHEDGQATVDSLAASVMQHTEGESRQIQDIRKRFVFFLADSHVQTERVNLVFQAQQDLAAGGKTREPAYVRWAAPASTPTQSKLREKVAARARSRDPAPAQAASNQTNPFEPTEEAPTPECRTVPLVAPVLPPPIEGGELEVESQEDHDRLDNDLLGLPASPDYDKVLLSPETVRAFASPATHAHALGMVKELLQQKELIAKLEYEARIKQNPHDVEVGAPLFGNMPGFARNMPPGLRQFNIDLIPGSKPVRQGMRRFTSEETQEIKRQVERMAAAGVVEACHSPFASGVVLARKKCGSFRFAVDLRKLNAITADAPEDVWLLPRIDDCLRKCAGMQWFTLLDARSAFWSIPLGRASRLSTAFMTPLGQFAFTRLPMGARCAPQFFQRCAEFLAAPQLKGPGVTIDEATEDEATLCYLDDITLVTRGTYQQHIAYLGKFLDKLIYHGFTLNLEKCRFLKISIELLGHCVGRDGISPTPTYVAKVADFQNFRVVKDVQAWLGLSGFYRGYLKNYAQRTRNMRKCLEICRLDRNRTQLGSAWDAACEAERLDICKSLQCTKCGPLVHPRFDRGFIFECDGSVTPGGVGGCLTQLQDDGSVRPIGYASRALTTTQLKWDVSRIEAWCIVFMLRHFFWAISPQFKHVIVTDHAALRWMDSMIKHNSPSNRQLVRFSLEIHQTGPHIFQHRPGLVNGGPDGLSRLTGADISIDGRRDRSAPGGPQPDVWADCRYITDAAILRVVDQEAARLEVDPRWSAWRDVPSIDNFLGNQVGTIQTELLRQNTVRKQAALGPELIAALDAACSGPLEEWGGRLAALNIQYVSQDERPVFGPPPPPTDGAQQQLNAFLHAGLGGRDDELLVPGWDSRPTQHVRINKDQPELDTPFDDEIREVLPSLSAAQRADPFFGPVFAYLEVAASDHAAAWMQVQVPSDPLPGNASQPISTTTLLDIAATCFIDDDGILRRFRYRTRNCHSVRIPSASDDRGLICVPRALRLPLLTLYHEQNGRHQGRGRFTDALLADYWWPSLVVDATAFVAQCHVCLSNKASRVSKQTPLGHFDNMVEPSVEVVADPVGPLPLTPDGYCYLLVCIDRGSRWIEGVPMKSNSTESLLAAFLIFVWRRGCPRILYSDRGGNLLSFLAYKVYQRLGVTKVSGSAHRHRTSGLCERAIQSLLAMLTCDMSGEQHHLNWLDRLPPILWSLNTSVSASTGYSPFYLEHGREPRDIASRAMDTSDIPAASQEWAVVMQQRLALARKVQSSVQAHAADEQEKRENLPKVDRRKPAAFLPGSYCYYQVQRFARAATDGMKFTPIWSGPYLVRSTVPGSEHRYLLSRTETSATFDAHATRMRPSPHKTFGVVALESKVADGVGSGRGLHLMDPTIVFEIDKILEVNDKEALVSFMGNEINARWVSRADLAKQGLNDLLADFLDGSPSTLISATSTSGPRFTMSQTAVARLEGSRTHDGFERPYFKGPWVDICTKCAQDGTGKNRLLICDFCPKAFHFGCAGLDVRTRAQTGDWMCPDCRKADDLTRLDAKPARRARPPTGTAMPTTNNITATPPSTLPVVTERLRRPVGRPPKKPPRNRPKAVTISSADPEILPQLTDEEGEGNQPSPLVLPPAPILPPSEPLAAERVRPSTTELPRAPPPQPTQAPQVDEVPVWAAPPPAARSRVTRLGSAQHGTILSSLPTTGRMLLVQSPVEDPPLPTTPAPPSGWPPMAPSGRVRWATQKKFCAAATEDPGTDSRAETRDPRPEPRRAAKRQRDQRTTERTVRMTFDEQEDLGANDDIAAPRSFC